jgi:cell wall assembly regulator SMI1
LLSEYNLKELLLNDKIDELYKKFEAILSPDIKKFYKYYTGQIDSSNDIGLALKFLMEILNERYKNKVMLFVDEHDDPVGKIHLDKPLTNSEEDKAFEESIKVYSRVM